MKGALFGELLLLCAVLVLVYLVWLHDQQLRELTPLVDRALLTTEQALNGDQPATATVEPKEVAE